MNWILVGIQFLIVLSMYALHVWNPPFLYKHMRDLYRRGEVSIREMFKYSTGINGK